MKVGVMDHLKIAKQARKVYGDRMAKATPGTVEYYRLWGDYRYYDGMVVGLKITQVDNEVLSLILDLKHDQIAKIEFLRRVEEVLSANPKGGKVGIGSVDTEDDTASPSVS